VTAAGTRPDEARPISEWNDGNARDREAAMKLQIPDYLRQALVRRRAREQERQQEELHLHDSEVTA
jgi:hypothetical protein